MRRAAALNLVVLGGGLTLFGAAGVLSEQRRAAACQRAREAHSDLTDPNCSNAHTGYAPVGGGHHAVWSGYGSARGSVTRGGFGGFGAHFGGGS
jgi:hypothetical protein